MLRKKVGLHHAIGRMKSPDYTTHLGGIRSLTAEQGKGGWTSVGTGTGGAYGWGSVPSEGNQLTPEEREKREKEGLLATKEAMMKKIRTFKFYLGLLMMGWNLAKKVLGNTQIMSKGLGLLNTAFGFILDMIFLPLLPLLIAIVKAMFWLGETIHGVMNWLKRPFLILIWRLLQLHS